MLLQRASDNRLRETLEESNCEMDELTAASFGDLIQDMGLTAASDVHEIQALVAEFVAGWAMSKVHCITKKTSRLIRGAAIPYRDQPEWGDLASIFAHAFSIRSIRPLRLRDTEALKVCRSQSDFSSLY